MKSLYGYKKFWVEEGEGTSQASLDTMGPTLRGVADAEIWISLNIKSTRDPVYLHFIGPHIKTLRKTGYFENDYVLIINVNYDDNPWFELDSTLVGELARSQKDVLDGVMTQEKFDHIWRGEPDEEVENAIIPAAWFEASLDAHKKLGFKPRGLKMVTHDPSDTGPDAKAVCLRQGSIILDVEESHTGDINEGGDWAADWAIQYNADYFLWDCDGMGVGLNRQIHETLHNRPITIEMFKGSQAPDLPDVIYKGLSTAALAMNPKTHKETFKNKRAQYYWLLRERFYNTYRAVVKGEYVDPDDLIAISSDIKNLNGLKSELCSIPLKPNGSGLIQIMTKDEMLKLGIPSPNMADAIMMSMKTPPVLKKEPVLIPTPLATMGGRRRAV